MVHLYRPISTYISRRDFVTIPDPQDPFNIKMNSGTTTRIAPLHIAQDKDIDKIIQLSYEYTKPNLLVYTKQNT